MNDRLHIKEIEISYGNLSHPIYFAYTDKSNIVMMFKNNCLKSKFTIWHGRYFANTHLEIYKLLYEAN